MRWSCANVIHLLFNRCTKNLQAKQYRYNRSTNTCKQLFKARVNSTSIQNSHTTKLQNPLLNTVDFSFVSAGVLRAGGRTSWAVWRQQNALVDYSESTAGVRNCGAGNGECFVWANTARNVQLQEQDSWQWGRGRRLSRIYNIYVKFSQEL